jgi:hypothetical protein
MSLVQRSALASRGMPVLERGGRLLPLVVVQPLLHPDTGVVEGVSLRARRWGSPLLAIRTDDLTRWTDEHLVVTRAEAISPVADFVRFQAWLTEGRTLVGQRVVTLGGRRLGRCRDVLFDDELLQLIAIVPRRWGIWQLPVRRHDVLEVRPQAIIVRDVELPVVAPLQQDTALVPG